MRYRSNDAFVRHLADEMGALIAGDLSRQTAVRNGLRELTIANGPRIAEYWGRIGAEVGVPDSAFRGEPLYWFGDTAPARVFRTSGTSGPNRGAAAYSARGLELMDLSILASARAFGFKGLERPVVLRLVPDTSDAPEMIMAYGMSLIARTLGHPELGASVIGPSGVDFARLERVLDSAVAAKIPVVVIGGSFGIVNVCDALEKSGKRWELPAGSRLIDAGGFKGRSRVVNVDDLRGLAERTFAIPRASATNLFGMTELSSQLYDGDDTPVGPLGERAKGRTPYVWATLRDPRTLAETREPGRVGLVELTDLAILDRPFTLLSGDLGVVSAESATGGVAIVGRAERRSIRGCSLSLEQITR